MHRQHCIALQLGMGDPTQSMQGSGHLQGRLSFCHHDLKWASGKSKKEQAKSNPPEIFAAVLLFSHP